MKIVSFIPIKLNNQRLPGKNLMDLGGRPLCSYMFETINSIDYIDEKYVFCSDDSIQKYIPEGLIYLKRESWLDGNEVKGLEIIEAFVEKVDADIYVLAHVTQPFTTAKSIKTCIEKVANEGYDSAFPAIEFNDYFWFNGAPLNYDPSNIVRTQDVTPLLMETGSFFIFKKEVFAKSRRRIGFKPYIHRISSIEGVDIDTKEDFVMAQAINSIM